MIPSHWFLESKRKRYLVHNLEEYFQVSCILSLYTNTHILAFIHTSSSLCVCVNRLVKHVSYLYSIWLPWFWISTSLYVFLSMGLDYSMKKKNLFTKNQIGNRIYCSLSWNNIRNQVFFSVIFSEVFQTTGLLLSGEIIIHLLL